MKFIEKESSDGTGTIIVPVWDDADIDENQDLPLLKDVDLKDILSGKKGPEKGFKRIRKILK